MQNFAGQIRCSLGNVEVTYLSHSCHPGHPMQSSQSPYCHPSHPSHPSYFSHPSHLRHTCPSRVSLVSTSTQVIFFFNLSHLSHLNQSLSPRSPYLHLSARSSDPRKRNLGELWVLFLILKIQTRRFCLIFYIKKQFMPEKRKFVGISTGYLHWLYGRNFKMICIPSHNAFAFISIMSLLFLS